MRRVGSSGLGYGQMFLLLVGFLLASALIFLFGIWVGRDIAERRLAQEERLVKAPAPPRPTPAEETGVDTDFYQNLKATAYQRLQETAAATSPTPPRGTPAPAATVVPATPAGTTRTTPRPTQVPRTRTPAQTAAGGEWADAGWTVQVNATTSAEQASELARSLRAKGYEAYTVQAPVRGQTWYRVRVGRFGSKEQAKAMEQRLKGDGLDSAYVTAQ